MFPDPSQLLPREDLVCRLLLEKKKTAALRPLFRDHDTPLTCARTRTRNTESAQDAERECNNRHAAYNMRNNQEDDLQTTDNKPTFTTCLPLYIFTFPKFQRRQRDER